MIYQLFVARDFDVIERKFDASDRDTAERIAADAIAQAYGLQPDSFDELVPQTDGYYLELFEATPVRREVRVGWAEAAEAIGREDSGDAADWRDFGNEGDDELTW